MTQTGIANTATIGYNYSNGLLSTITRTDGQSKAQTYTFGYDAFGNTTTIRVGTRLLASYSY